MFRCSKYASGSGDSKLVRSSVDPPGELDGVRVSYLLDLWGADVGGGD